MSNRSVKFVPALLAGVVAGANLATMTDLRAQVAAEAASDQVAQAATDSCLSAPKGATPSGSHWYYRIDRNSKRQCWYLREESDKADDKFARAAPASFGACATVGSSIAGSSRASSGSRRQRSHASRSPTRAPNGSPSRPAPNRIRPPGPSRERSGQPPHRPSRIVRAQPCRTCSRPRRCRRCDGTTLPPQVLRAIQPLCKRRQPPLRRQTSRCRKPRKCSSPQQIRLPLPPQSRRRQSRPHRCRCCFW